MLKKDHFNSAKKAFTLQNNCRLEANCESTKRIPIYPIIGVVALALSMLFGILRLNTNSTFLGILSLLFVLCAIAFLIVELFARAKFDNEMQELMDKANQTYFENAEVIPVFSTERMFQSDAVASISVKGDKSTATTTVDSVNTDLTFADVVEQFITFATERGCKIDTASAKGLFASFAASRVLILRGMQAKEFETLVGVIGEYFGTQARPDLVDDSYTCQNDLLFSAGGQKKTAKLVLESAQAEREKIHLLVLSGVTASAASTCLDAFVQYANAPEAPHSLSAKISAETNTYYLPANLWIILNLAENERIVDLPTSLLEVACTCDIAVSLCDKAEAFAAMEHISYSQMSILIALAKCTVDESDWKKLDVFSDSLEKSLLYKISNKQWIAMEKYISVCNACFENSTDALDKAIAAKILPDILAKALVADKKLDIVTEVMNAFGDVEMPKTRKAAKELVKSNLRA